jgi:hypothetical protein
MRGGSLCVRRPTGRDEGVQAHRAAVAALTRMTASTDWPRIGPAAYCATTQENDLRREANPQLDEHLTASPQVVESVSRTLSRWRHRFESRWEASAKPVARRLAWAQRYVRFWLASDGGDAAHGCVVLAQDRGAFCWSAHRPSRSSCKALRGPRGGTPQTAQVQVIRGQLIPAV